jgi:Dynamin family
VLACNQLQIEGIVAEFANRIQDLSAWRESLSESLRVYNVWLDDSKLGDPAISSRLARMQARLATDKLVIAFVAEFSRGKSELINALFFSTYGRRILPSSAGRTTMCPTELGYDTNQAPSIRLLPIETRAEDRALSDFRSMPEAWTDVPVDVDDAQSMANAFAKVSETIRVPQAKAHELGLFDPSAADASSHVDDAGTVEISKWRHALVNYPHELFKQGLVIIDTPGLNAIGAEPELTFSLLPSAHGVLFVLAADTGVTASDLDVWRNHVGNHQSSFVVLNKIDGLWDSLKAAHEVEAEIKKQVATVAETLKINSKQIFPVSAQKALQGRVQANQELIRNSRVQTLERALGETLLPQRQILLSQQIETEFKDLKSSSLNALASRRRSLLEQSQELASLRTKNRSTIDVMAQRIQQERLEFDRILVQMQGLRAVHGKHSEKVLTAIGSESLKKHVRTAREQMKSSVFSLGMRSSVQALFNGARADFELAGKEVEEVSIMLGAMCRTFNTQYGLSLGQPMPFSLNNYSAELDSLQSRAEKHFDAISLLTNEKWILMRKFFESVATRMKVIYERASQECSQWLRAIMAPLEGQIKDTQGQLRRRLESVRRVFDASDSLEEKITEMDVSRSQVDQQLEILEELSSRVLELTAPRSIYQAPPSAVSAVAPEAFQAIARESVLVVA